MKISRLLGYKRLIAPSAKFNTKLKLCNNQLMIESNLIEDLIDYINKEIQQKLKERLSATYLVGSYVLGTMSTTRPDINWLLFWNRYISGEDMWVLGNVITDSINKFEDQFTVRPEFRPFKFSYPIQKTKDDVFININNAIYTENENLLETNLGIPPYLFAGFKNSKQLVFGTDLLDGLNIDISIDVILQSAIQKIMSHRVQLERVPLTYHLIQESDLIFNESLAHGKNLLYFAIEMLMSDEELKQMKFLDVYSDETKVREFFKDRMANAVDEVEVILESKKNYPAWKYNAERTKDIYLAVYNLSNLMLQRL